ncbi:MAG: hypothetical protein JRJ85_08875 [Deltaproteobacteria bacterium]|nr:hypothetical protein [Deltaproteobacteria bacterium]
MEDVPEAALQATPEQLLYARILEKGMLIGLITLFITFFIYVLGIMKPYVPLDDVSRFWSMNVGDYLHHADIKPGWAWFGMLGYGDFINFIGVAVLAGTTLFCYLAVLPILVKNKDWIYGILALLEAVVLFLAASGIITGGH